MRGVLVLVFALALALPAAAYEGGYSGGMGGMSGGGASAGFSNRVTKQVVRILRRDFGGCLTLDKVYRYDCYRQTYRLAINQMAGNPAYRPALKALEGVEDRLHRIVVENADPAQPPVRKLFRQYSAIKPAAVPQSKRQLTRALEEAETVLLRSAEENKHLLAIAEAVNSNKLLLRSAMLVIFGPVLALLE